MEQHSIKYVHIREFNIDGVPLPNGGSTLAFLRIAQTEDRGDMYHVSQALCSHRDNFCKKIGRSVATGRLLCGMYDVVKTNKTKMKEVAEDMMKWALTNGN